MPCGGDIRVAPSNTVLHRAPAAFVGRKSLHKPELAATCLIISGRPPPSSFQTDLHRTNVAFLSDFVETADGDIIL